MPPSRSAVARRLDVWGQVLAVVLLSSLTYALIGAARYGWTSPRILAIFAADVVLAFAFLRVESRTTEPLLDLRFFRDRQFSGATFITVAAFFAFGGFIYENTLFLERGRGYSALAAGLLTLPAALPTLAGGPISGWLVATRGPRGVLASSTLTMAVALTALALLPGDAPIVAFLGCYLLLGIGYGVLNAPLSTVAVASMPKEQAGVAAAVVSSGRNVGIVLGIAALGSLVAAKLPADGTVARVRRGAQARLPAGGRRPGRRDGRGPRHAARRAARDDAERRGALGPVGGVRRAARSASAASGRCRRGR